MKPIQVLEDAKDSVTSVTVQEHEILSGSVDGRLRCYDLRMGMVKVDLIGRECLLFFPYGPPCRGSRIGYFPILTYF